jgi:hypothetical protein
MELASYTIPPIDVWHEQLPQPFRHIMDRILWKNVPYADEYLLLIGTLLCILTIVQTKAFARPPPVPLKHLPKRPCLSIQFQPDDPITVRSSNSHRDNHRMGPPQLPLMKNHVPMVSSAAMAAASTAAQMFHTTSLHSSTTPTTTATATRSNNKYHIRIPKNASFIQRIDGFMSRRLLFRGGGSQNDHEPDHWIDPNHRRSSSTTQHNTSATAQVDSSSRTRIRPDGTTKFVRSHKNNRTTPVLSTQRTPSSRVGNVETIPWNESDDWDDDDDDNDNHAAAARSVPPPPPQYSHHTTADSNHHHNNDNDDDDVPFVRNLQDLPDSFAPLLSSSFMTMLTQQLTADLVHAVQLEGEIRLRCGRHEVPLDQDTSRPQFVLDVPDNNGCRISVVAMIGSDGLSNEHDIDVHRTTMSRSKPMVKHAGLVLDPPLALSNVAPTLIHFPTLFEDRNMIPVLRSIQVIRYIVDFIVSISSFLEKCLWILESQCQVHLSKVRITPLYKGQSSTSTSNSPSEDAMHNTAKSPKWRLQLAFSGHVLVFGWIPVPFISITLPSFIIPQPHALLEFLISA